MFAHTQCDCAYFLATSFSSHTKLKWSIAVANTSKGWLRKKPCLSSFMKNPPSSEGSYSCIEAYICCAWQGRTVPMLGKCPFHYNSLYKVSLEQFFCWTTLSLPSLISSANSGVWQWITAQRDVLSSVRAFFPLSKHKGKSSKKMMPR